MPSCIPCTNLWLSTADASLNFALSNICMYMSASVSSVARALHCQALWLLEAVDQTVWRNPLATVADSRSVHRDMQTETRL